MNTRLKFLSGSYLDVANQLNHPFYTSINQIEMTREEYLRYLEIDPPRTLMLCKPNQYQQLSQLMQNIPEGRLFYLQGDLDAGIFTEASFNISNLYESYDGDQQDALIYLNQQGAIRFAYLDDEKKLCALSVSVIKDIVGADEKKSLFQVAIIKNATHSLTEREVTLISHPLLLPVGAYVKDEIGLKEVEKIFKKKLNSNRLYPIFKSVLANDDFAYDLFYGDFKKIIKAAPNFHSINMSALDRLGVMGNAGFYQRLIELEDKAVEMEGRGHVSATQIIRNVAIDLTKEKMKFINGESNARNFAKNCNAIVSTAETTELKDHRNFFSKLFNEILKALAFVTSGLIKVDIKPTHSLFMLNKIKVTTGKFSTYSENNNKKKI